MAVTVGQSVGQGDGVVEEVLAAGGQGPAAPGSPDQTGQVLDGEGPGRHSVGVGDGHGRHELPVLVALGVGGGAPGVEVAVGGVGEDGIGAGRPDPPVPAVGQPVVGDVGQGPGADGGQFGQARRRCGWGGVGWPGWVVRVDNVHLPVAGNEGQG